jgi:hypothetical protein
MVGDANHHVTNPHLHWHASAHDAHRVIKQIGTNILGRSIRESIYLKACEQGIYVILPQRTDPLDIPSADNSP